MPENEMDKSVDVSDFFFCSGEGKRESERWKRGGTALYGRSQRGGGLLRKGGGGLRAPGGCLRGILGGGGDFFRAEIPTKLVWKTWRRAGKRPYKESIDNRLAFWASNGHPCCLEWISVEKFSFLPSPLCITELLAMLRKSFTVIF